MSARWVLCSLVGLLNAGCVVSQLEVTNPYPGLSTVAVAPFFNISHERAVDGRRFALAYFTELQKTPGFEVVPVGVTEQAIHDYGLEMDNPADAVRLAEILNVDAVVVGAVTDYDPYYPPRIGLQVSWFSPHQWPFFPGVQTNPDARRELRDAQVQFEDEQYEARKAERRAMRQAKAEGRPCPDGEECEEENPRKLRIPIPWYVRGQSPDGGLELESSDWRTVAAGAEAEAPSTWRSLPAPSSAPRMIVETETLRATGSRRSEPNIPPPPLPSRESPRSRGPGAPPVAVPPKPQSQGSTGSDTGAESQQMPEPGSSVPFAPVMPAVPIAVSPESLTPIMAYTRMFDGADADLVAALRDYVELSGDRRSGGWEAYLHRSEDFIRFTAHRMILEMLMLHGGEGRRRIVVKHRNVR